MRVSILVMVICVRIGVRGICVMVRVDSAVVVIGMVTESKTVHVQVFYVLVVVVMISTGERGTFWDGE